MRIVAGELKGRRLVAPRPGVDIRPTADRVREALFAMLGDVTDGRVADLFCGTGALGIEALSRGAAHCIFVDRNTRLAARNIAALGLEERSGLVRGDAVAQLRAFEERFDLILCDPPYRLVARLEPELGTLVPDRLARGGRFVLETAARRDADLPPPLRLERERRYGDSRLTIWSHDGR